jgi:serine/threonine protein kinase
MDVDVAGAERLIMGRYRLGTVLGRGGMGVVWGARDELLSRDVAVKELFWPASWSAEERLAACRRATREAQVAARLSHRNVVRVFDVAEEDGRPWIVMELLPQGSLRDMIDQEGPLSPEHAARIGLDILAALRAAHAEGIVHLDVKPANIAIAPGRAVLTDFGIARTVEPSTITAGVLIGSPSYIAPERARGGRPGPASDLWGLGASLYAAVEGHAPFDRDGDALASLTAAVADEPEPAVHAGPRLWPVISGLLRKNPDERLDAAAAERMLHRVANPPAMAATPPAIAATSPAAPKTRRSLRSAAALAIVASGISAGLALNASPRHATAAGLPAAASSRTPHGTHPKAPGATRMSDRLRRTAPVRPASAPAARAATGHAAAKDGLAVQTASVVRAAPHGKALGKRHAHHAGGPAGAGHGKAKGNGKD